MTGGDTLPSLIHHTVEVRITSEVHGESDDVESALTPRSSQVRN